MAGRTIDEMIKDEDCLSIDEANVVADNLYSTEINEFLLNLAQGDGTPNESMLAAILRGLILDKLKSV